MYLRKSVLLTIFTLTVILLTHPVYAGVLFVKEGGTGNGTSWADAFGDPQEAIETAAADDDYSQVWVAAGTYYPTWHPNGGSTDMEMHFSLRNDVTIYGGFIGQETVLEERDFEANKTVFSGKIIVRSDNVSYIFYHPDGSELNESAMLDGIKITEGRTGMYNYSSSPTLTNVAISDNKWKGMYNYYSNPNLNNVIISNNSGGGMYNYYSNPTLTNVDIVRNSTSSSNGGGMYNRQSSSPKLTNVNISGNSTSFNGGGIYNRMSSNPNMTNVAIFNNTASDGGGMYNERSSNPKLNNVTISGNSASHKGGGIYNDDSTLTITNVTLSGNQAEEGGAIFNNNDVNSVITNCTIVNNSADYGGGIYNSASSPIIRNTIFWDNSASESGDDYINSGSSSPEVSWSIFKRIYPGGTNIITQDPVLQPLADNGGFTKT